MCPCIFNSCVFSCVYTILYFLQDEMRIGGIRAQLGRDIVIQTVPFSALMTHTHEHTHEHDKQKHTHTLPKFDRTTTFVRNFTRDVFGEVPRLPEPI